MKNKKGILVPEVLKIIIAVMSILLLIYLAFALFFPGKSDKEKFGEKLDEMIILINRLEDGQSINYILTNPGSLKGEGMWYLVQAEDSYYNDAGLIGFVNYLTIPSFCSEGEDKSCLCACPTKSAIVRLNCVNDGICVKINHKIGEGSEINLDMPFDNTGVQIIKNNGGVLIKKDEN